LTPTKSVKICVIRAIRVLKHTVCAEVLRHIGSRVLGEAIHFALPAFSGNPIHHAVDGREVRDLPFEIPLWSGWGRRYGERPRSWGAIHFALPAFSCTPIHRAVAQPGHGFVVRFIVELKHFSPVEVAFLSVWPTGFIAL
jgi:hypothetical protein